MLLGLNTLQLTWEAVVVVAGRGGKRVGMVLVHRHFTDWLDGEYFVLVHSRH